ncbi:glycosyltransferase family 2 protein [Desulfobacter postgatei]|uniref:glycosyltransferase family 2 protein n=1 Tax=Desulfobacter postgatei TaxID=2293 RepID=UPI00259B9BAB|nr:glycosyltransferase family 2 protein [uncultured Desulfobacter sp.]
MDLSFVILTWNSEKYISKCLSSIVISLESSYLSYEVLIVDNGSQDNTVNLIEAQKGINIRLIKLDRNTGTTYSRNLAIQRAMGEFICIMDSDVELQSGTIEKLITNLKETCLLGIAVPKLIYPDGRRQKTTDHFPTIHRKIIRYFFLRQIEKIEETDRKSNTVHEVDYAISALWVLQKDMINKIGSLDENITYSPEDADYCLRVWNAGYHILYNPEVFAVHHTQEITRNFNCNKATVEHIKGLFYYFRKHRYYFRAPVFKYK